MGAVEDPGSAGGGGERRAGEGTERLERGREEGGKETFEPAAYTTFCFCLAFLKYQPEYVFAA